MLDLTGFPALDLAIGLAFVFFLLSTLAATLQEFLAAALGLRARTLEQGLRSLLEDSEKGWRYVDKFYDHGLIRSLYRTDPPAVLKSKQPAAPDAATKGATGLGRNAGKAARGRLRRALGFFERTAGPSYISPRSFALVVLDNLAPDKGGKTIFDAGNKVIEELPADLRKRLEPLVAGPQRDVETLRTNLEAWYDDTMARVSGWYKRKTQIILLVIGAVLVIAVNANTIRIGERLWKDDTVRAAVIAQAQAGANAEAERSLGQAADGVEKVAAVDIPIGWRGAAAPDGLAGLPLAIAGWVLTLAAISLGAPFWFDTLSRLSRLRSSGKPETPLPAPGSGKPNERILTPPQAPTVVIQHERPT